MMTSLGISEKMKKAVSAFASEAAKRATKKIGCEIGKEAAVQGVYVLLLGTGQLYVGQSIDIKRRFGEHLRDLEKAGAKIVGMLKITTGVEEATATKYLREIFEKFLIDKLPVNYERGLANKIKNPVADPKRFAKYADPVRAGIDKLFEVIPFCKGM